MQQAQSVSCFKRISYLSPANFAGNKETRVQIIQRVEGARADGLMFVDDAFDPG